MSISVVVEAKFCIHYRYIFFNYYTEPRPQNFTHSLYRTALHAFHGMDYWYMLHYIHYAELVRLTAQSINRFKFKF